MTALRADTRPARPRAGPRTPVGDAKPLRVCTRGATALTYGLLVGLVALVALAAISTAGKSLLKVFSQVDYSLEGANSPAVPLRLVVLEGDPVGVTLFASPGPGRVNQALLRVAIQNAGEETSAPLRLNLDRRRNFALEQDECSGQRLSPGDECSTSITASASFSGPLRDQLIVRAGRSVESLSLTGLAMGFNPPRIEVTIAAGDPDAMDVTGPGSPAFGARVRVRVQNVGEQATVPLAGALATGANVRVLAHGCLGSVLEGGQSCEIELEAMASANGPIIDRLFVIGNNGAEVRLRGLATGFNPT